jgi:hypothetical protein
LRLRQRSRGLAKSAAKACERDPQPVVNSYCIPVPHWSSNLACRLLRTWLPK